MDWVNWWSLLASAITCGSSGRIWNNLGKEENHLFWQKHCSSFLRASTLLCPNPAPAQKEVSPQAGRHPGCLSRAEAKMPGENGHAGDEQAEMRCSFETTTCHLLVLCLKSSCGQLMPRFLCALVALSAFIRGCSLQVASSELLASRTGLCPVINQRHASGETLSSFSCVSPDPWGPRCLQPRPVVTWNSFPAPPSSRSVH